MGNQNTKPKQLVSKGTGKGKVKFFNGEKQFGFIERDGQADIFFHDSNVKFDGIQQGDKVTFKIGDGKKGDQAFDVEQE